MKGHATLMSSVQQDWRTPRVLFEAFDAMAGGFTLDAAADFDSRMVIPWLGPGGLEPDALTTSWANRGGAGRNRVWLNPPYGRTLWPFVAKAVGQVAAHHIDVWMLVPARTDTRWWQLAMTRAVQVWFLAGRVKFERADGARDAAPFPSAVIRLGYTGGNPSVVWGWRP